LYLGYMSGLTPEQLILRAPASWSPWIKRFRLRRPSGVRGWPARVRDLARAGWARLAWVGGRPYLGFNRTSLAVAAVLAMPVIGLFGLVAARPPAEYLLTPDTDWLYVERPRVVAWHADTSVSDVAFSRDGRRIVSGGFDGVWLWD